MLEIYKKLPKTNCGDCGEPSCMSFAQKVMTGQRTLSNCPHVEDANKETADAEPVESLDDMYERVSSRMEEDIHKADFRTAAEAIGAECVEFNGEAVIRLKMVNTQYEVRKDGLYVDGEHSHDSWAKMIIYDYICRGGDQPVTENWVAFDHFPRTPSHIKMFQKTAERQLAETFNRDTARLKAHITEMGGIEKQAQVKADYSCELYLLPKVPLFLSFWAEDEDFPASSKLFVDSSANSYLDMEFLGHLVEKFVDDMTAS